MQKNLFCIFIPLINIEIHGENFKKICFLALKIILRENIGVCFRRIDSITLT